MRLYARTAIRDHRPRQRETTHERSRRNVGTDHHQLDPRRPAGPPGRRSPDPLVEPGPPARPERTLRGLVPLRRHRPLRAHARLRQHPRHDPRDLRDVRPGRLPRGRTRRAPGAYGDGRRHLRQRPVSPGDGDIYFRCPEARAGVPGGNRGVRQAPRHLRGHHDGVDLPAHGRADIRGQRPPGSCGVALADAAEVGRSHVGRRGRAHVPHGPRVRGDDRAREHASYGGGGGWIALRAMRRPSFAAEAIGVRTQSRAQ